MTCEITEFKKHVVIVDVNNFSVETHEEERKHVEMVEVIAEYPLGGD